MVATVTATPGNLSALDSRFRDHTLGLFAKHGMTNLVDWHLAPGSPQSDRMLVYLLGHANREAADKSFADFRVDPDWLAARTASEGRAGRSPSPRGAWSRSFSCPPTIPPGSDRARRVRPGNALIRPRDPVTRKFQKAPALFRA